VNFGLFAVVVGMAMCAIIGYLGGRDNARCDDYQCDCDIDCNFDYIDIPYTYYDQIEPIELYCLGEDCKFQTTIVNISS